GLWQGPERVLARGLHRRQARDGEPAVAMSAHRPPGTGLDAATAAAGKSPPGAGSGAGELAAHDIVRIRAENPGPLSLEGTNSWVVGRDPAYVIDPGPLLDAHLQALDDAIVQRGGLGGIAVTHGH